MVEKMSMDEFVAAQKSEFLITIENGEEREDEAEARDTLHGICSSAIEDFRRSSGEDDKFEMGEEDTSKEDAINLANRRAPPSTSDYFDTVNDEKTRKIIGGLYADADKALKVGQYFYF
jgi:hypothetical protein